ncbi:uncharacterized protein LOC131149232 [Malania oleifera]|uniref:uncharacterized protein LOC131149232 n=1 Tax=Malania oleifera TaxID=397392 RepID=UPI0025ADDD4B|nr:uncharacterized protein LOC131149232 [Malania oleifera]
MDLKDQVIRCKAKCLSTANSFALSFVYGFNSILARRGLWMDLTRFSHTHDPWLVLGDFNCVMSSEEKQNGVPATAYEVKDINDCFMEASLMDLNYTGFHFTWSNGNVWCKLDRAVVNHNWSNAGFITHTEFQFPGVYSDHSPCIVTLFEEINSGRRPFKFFNMWVNHDNFLEVIKKGWVLNVQGYAQYRFLEKLKGLKQPLRNLNSLHFSHITSRAEKAMEEVVKTQQLLHDSPGNLEIQRKLKENKGLANRLAEANRQFLSQRAKAKFLKDSDKGTSYFHALMRRQTHRNHISAVMKEDGERTTSEQQVVEEFLGFYKNLLGKEEHTESIDAQVVARGRLINVTQADQMVAPISEEEVKMLYLVLEIINHRVQMVLLLVSSKKPGT